MSLNLKKIEQLRINLGLSQHEAALKAGLSGRQQWSNLVSGRFADPRLSTIEGVAKALGVTVCDLLK